MHGIEGRRDEQNRYEEVREDSSEIGKPCLVRKVPNSKHSRLLRHRTHSGFGLDSQKARQILQLRTRDFPRSSIQNAGAENCFADFRIWENRFDWSQEESRYRGRI